MSHDNGRMGVWSITTAWFTADSSILYFKSLRTIGRLSEPWAKPKKDKRRRKSNHLAWDSETA